MGNVMRQVGNNSRRMTSEKRKEDQRIKAEDQLRANWETVQNGGYMADNNMVRRAGAYNYGRDLGQKEFYDDPDMKLLRDKRIDMANGYDGQELGAMRETARGEIAGQRSNYLRTLAGKLGRGGVGGARAAAMQGAADQGYAKTTADMERKMALDSAQMKRQGQNDLQDFMFRQKLGAVGMGYGQQAFSSADYAADKGVEAANSGGGGGNFWSFFGL